MAASADVYRQIKKPDNIAFPVLVPNMKGLEAAVEVGAKEIAVFVSASETFSKKNINCTIAESLARTKEVCEAAAVQRIRVRGYLQCFVVTNIQCG